MTGRLYCLTALLGLVGLAVGLALQSPLPWGHLSARFTPELAAVGFFGGGLLAGVAIGVSKFVSLRLDAVDAG